MYIHQQRSRPAILCQGAIYLWPLLGPHRDVVGDFFRPGHHLVCGKQKTPIHHF